MSGGPATAASCRSLPTLTSDQGRAYVYFWGTPAGRFGGLSLMRVPTDRVEDLAAYRYFAGAGTGGQPVWSPDLAAARLVVDHQVGEPSVWNDYLQRWILTAQ